MVWRLLLPEVVNAVIWTNVFELDILGWAWNQLFQTRKLVNDLVLES